MKCEYDVIVIGSGVAGALTAWKLAQLGKYKILILEAGDNGITEGQRLKFHHTMDTQGHRGTPYAPYADLESRKYAPVAEKSQRELADQKKDPDNYYDYTDETKDPFKAGYNRMGATISPKAKPLDNQQTARVNWNTAAHMGTTIIGDDPRDSVVDRWGRTHEVPNLWIVGSSVFSTSATANPTLTIAALTLLTAAAIHRQMQGGNPIMTYRLVKGEYQVVGAQPDGDSVRFRPRNSDLLKGFPQGDAKITMSGPTKGTSQLRMESLDALELHYLTPADHQEIKAARRARDVLLSDMLGFQDV